MTKKCVICGKEFDTLSDTRKTCQLECAVEFRRRKTIQAPYEHIPNECDFNHITRQYHGRQLD